MPHKCVKCGALYPDGSDVVLTGCAAAVFGGQCESKVFLHLKHEQLVNGERRLLSLSPEHDHEEIDRAKPITLEVESVWEVKDGTYELDLARIASKEPTIFKLENGEYVIDLDQKDGGPRTHGSKKE